MICHKSVGVEYYQRDIPVLDRDNVALLVQLQLRHPKVKKESGTFCVANTHLLFNPRRGDVKLAQAMLLMAEIDQIRLRGDKKVPTILCGDLNCEPFSDLYKFFALGILKYEGLLMRNISGTEEGNYGRDYLMTKQIIPRCLGISDKCRFIYLASQLQGILDDNKEAGSTSQENVDTANDKIYDRSDETCLSPQHYPDKVESESSQKKTNDMSFEQSTGVISHDCKFVSVYNHETFFEHHKENEVSTYHGRANCTVDYMFYTVEKRQTRTKRNKFRYHSVKEGFFRLMAKLTLPTDAEMCKIASLPNRDVSSDHLILMAKFAIFP